ncbi:ATP synthase mitochondrial F1 complex assembly factor 2 like protein [Zymoseptoria brevis]|uniref:ATP synthase mitochondrial F1 complex assembly factor 2 like protein n=1 Tax=Zymoseptoria brevis TaxID=1047168 RepID=A0A0F4GUH6_9PEZI|nr:ATP synthase mitochondrial F1 complex assembly factor 2 like protein [Zymoseptoria brevis]
MEVSMFRSSIKAASSLSARRQWQQFAHPSICARCLLHTTPSKGATPVAHPTVPGPPPKAPQPAATSPDERIARKRALADHIRQSEQTKVNPAKPGSALQKRFWKNVHVKEDGDGGLQVLLDTRPVRTADRRILTLPYRKRALAAAIALEWEQLVSAQQALKQHYVPMTSLTSRAIDIQEADKTGETKVREQVVQMVLRYLSTDTLLCWAPEVNIHENFSMQYEGPKKNLRQRQKEAAEPIIAFLTTHVFPGVEIVPVLGADSIMPVPQPPETLNVIRSWVSDLAPYELAALERGVLATKSLLVAVRLLVEWSQEWNHLQSVKKEKFGIDEAIHAATIEVKHQTEQWGEVEDTHDVEKEDLKRQLGSAILLVS